MSWACSNAKGSVVEGFTIRDGEATYSQSGTDTVNGSGAGVLGISASKTYATANGCIVDCVVSNCVAVRGGGMRGLTAVRCWITENDASFRQLSYYAKLYYAMFV